MELQRGHAKKHCNAPDGVPYADSLPEACKTVVAYLYKEKKTLYALMSKEVVAVPVAQVHDYRSLPGRIADAIGRFIKENAAHATECAPVCEEDMANILQFIRAAVEGVMAFCLADLQRMKGKPSAEDLQERMPQAVAFASLLAAYPGRIASPVKIHAIDGSSSHTNVLHENDVSRRFLVGVSDAFLDLTGSELDQMASRRHCPAIAAVPQFTEVVYGMFLTAYSQMHHSTAEE